MVADGTGATLRVLCVVGTRPEAIKMAPVALELARRSGANALLLETGQHRNLVAPIHAFFGLSADHNLGVMGEGGLSGVLGRTIERMDAALRDLSPDVVLVHGDTTSALGGALAAFHSGLPVGHVEAGLRTHDLSRPFPEEMNRQVIDRIARFRYAPTERAVRDLRAEGLSGHVLHTGNTAIDALLWGLGRIEPAQPEPAGRRRILVTLHRREAREGGGMAAIARALARLAARGDVAITLPVHPSPDVRAVLDDVLGGCPAVDLVAPLDYPAFIAAMRDAYLIVTDSGGIQEEAPTLDVPVLVARDVTERPEGVEDGAAALVGLSENALFEAACRLLDDPAAHAAMAAVANPYGDGRAAVRIVDDLMAWHAGRAVAAA